MRTFEASIKIHNKGHYTIVKTRIQAVDAYAARALLESQYGVGNVVGFVQPVA
jgi:hypothetical protein